MKIIHTPGPWKAVPFFNEPLVSIDGNGEVWAHHSIHIFGPGDLNLGEFSLCTSKNAGYPRVTNMKTLKANVALVTAAPKMFAALKKAEAYLQGIRTGVDFEESDLVSIIQAAIAEAAPEA